MGPVTNPYGPQQYQQPQQPQAPAQNPAQSTIQEPPRSYIPSSKPFNAVSGDVSQAQAQATGDAITNPNVQAMLAKADKAEQAAMKYL